MDEFREIDGRVMNEISDRFLGNLNLSILDEFRSTFNMASETQLEKINNRHSSASGLEKDWVNEEGVQATMVRWLGEELILISLYHLLEKKLKVLIIHHHAEKFNSGSTRLGRWDEIKEHIPEKVKSTHDFQRINELRVLVNCFKHAGLVSEELHKLNCLYGTIGEEISCDIGCLYEAFKENASSVVKQTHLEYKA